MTTAIKRRRGTTAQHATFTGLEGEITIDTTKDTAVVHDGATAGGFPLAKESQATTNVAITGGTITGITDLAIADGGTGASTAADARTNLGVTATGADTTYAYRANNLSDLASASTARSNLGLGTIATQAASSVAITGGTIDGTIVGGTTRAAGSFTTVTSTNDASISGLTVGKGGGAVSTNTAIGNAALFSNTTASNNTAVGYQAGYSNTAASNSFFGYSAGRSTTTGSNSAFFGQQAGYSNTTGGANAAFGGGGVLYYNTTGANNTAIGNAALFNNTTASSNTAVGYQAGYSNTTGASNVFLGYAAGYASNASATTGFNVALGAYSGYSLTTGVGNTFVGSAGTSAKNGCGALITTGSKNTIIGAYDGNQNGLDIRTASNYIVLSDGDGNPAIIAEGAGSRGRTNIVSSLSDYTLNLHVPTGSQWNLIYFKKDGTVSADGTAVGYIGADQTNTRIYAQCNGAGGVYLASGGTSWTSASDERLKENLVPIENGLEKVCSLRSVVGNFITDEAKTRKPFLIAQDVQAVLPEAISGTTIKDDPTNTEYLGVSYTETIPLLVAAIKELNAKLEAQALEIATLKGK